MAIYTAQPMSFIDTYTNAAKYRDQRTSDANRAALEGATNLVKGGAEAYKWQERKDILSKKDELVKQLQEKKDELDRLMAGGSTPNFDTFMLGYNPSINTGRL